MTISVVWRLMKLSASGVRSLSGPGINGKPRGSQIKTCCGK